MLESRRKIAAFLALVFSGLLTFGTLHRAAAQSDPASSSPSPTDTPPAGTPRPTQPPQQGGSGGTNPDSGDGGDQPAQPSAPIATTGSADPTPEVIYMDPPVHVRRRDAGSGAASSPSDATPGPHTSAVPAREAHRGDAIHISGDGFAP